MSPVFRLQAPSLIAARIRKSRSGKVEVHREFRWGQALNVVISWQILIRTPTRRMVDPQLNCSFCDQHLCPDSRSSHRSLPADTDRSTRL